MRPAAFLRNVPVLAGLSEDLLERLAGQVTERRVRGSGWVIREGEPANSTLLELGREDFEALIQEAPSFSLGLTRSMGARLAASRSPIAAATPPKTIAVVGLGA